MIKIVDQVCGAGKTSAAINYMNAHKEKRILYVTPYKEQTTRVQNDCPLLDVQTILDDFETAYTPTKTAKLKELLSNGANVAITHALFTHIEPSFLLDKYDYTLIIDEEPPVISEIPIKKRDYENAFKCELVKVNDDGSVRWIDDSYNSEDGSLYTEIKRQLMTRRVIEVQKYAWFWIFNPDVFKCFKECYILTFRFSDSLLCYYLKKYELNSEFYHVEDDGDYKSARFVRGYEPITPQRLAQIRDCITVCPNPRWNAIGDKMSALSHNWFTSKDRKERKRPFKNAEMFFRGSDYDARMWTTFKAYNNPRYVPKGIRKCFVACNLRARIDLANKTKLAYLLNIYPSPALANYLCLDDRAKDGYALNTLIQWVFRSAIRNNPPEPIEIYIPSKRMRELFENWLLNG